MRRIPVALIVGVGLSLLTAPAAAKELHSAKICGESKCMVAKDKDDIRGFAFTALDADEPPSGPFYTVELSVLDGSGGKVSWTLDYMPDAGLIRVAGEFGEDDWWTLGTGAAQRLSAMTADLEPFPASAFQAAMDDPPGTFTTTDLAALADSPAPAQPAPAARPDSAGATWLIPVVIFLGIAGLTAVGLRVQHRRTTPAA
jgi:hypothetical protein